MDFDDPTPNNIILNNLILLAKAMALTWRYDWDVSGNAVVYKSNVETAGNNPLHPVNLHFFQSDTEDFQYNKEQPDSS